MTADEIAAQIAHVDAMIERCEKISVKDKPLRLDTSLPRLPVHKPVVSVPAQSTPSFDPQERFDRLRREWRADTTKAHDYPHICGGGGFGDDVDKAFEECSNAPY
jgi:hypothetical protein